MFTFLANAFIVMFLWGLFTFTMYALRVRKALRKYKDDPNIKGVHIVNGQVRVIEKEKNNNTSEVNQNVVDGEIKNEIKDMVYDSICKEEIAKSEAYHIIRDGESHYFCSWECREKFVESLE